MRPWAGGAWLLLTGCSPRAELWVAPDARITVTQNDAAWTSAEMHADAPARFSYPRHGPHEVRVHADGRPDVVGRFQVVEQGGGDESSANEIVLDSDRGALMSHPARFLRQDAGALVLPQRAQGVLIVADAKWGAAARFTCADPSGVLALEVDPGLRKSRTLIDGARWGTEPLAQELPVGTCEVWVNAAMSMPWKGTVDVVAGEYAWSQVHLARDNGRSSGGQGEPPG